MRNPGAGGVDALPVYLIIFVMLFNQSEKVDKDKGMSVADPLILARSVAAADFKGLTEWFKPGEATADAIQQLETAYKSEISSINVLDTIQESSNNR